MSKRGWLLIAGSVVVVLGLIGAAIAVFVPRANDQQQQAKADIVLHQVTDAGEQSTFEEAGQAVTALASAKAGEVLASGVEKHVDVSAVVPRGSTVEPDRSSWARAGRVAAVRASVTSGSDKRTAKVTLLGTDDGWRVLDLAQQDESDSDAPTKPGPRPTLAPAKCEGVQAVQLPTAKPGPTPVLLVPGPDGVAGLQAAGGTTAVPGVPAENASLAARIAAIPGVTAYVLTAGDPTRWVGDQDGSGPAVAAALDCLRQAAGRKVAVVAVSTGGLATRWALTEASGAPTRAASVAVVATVGTPYQGAYAVDVARALRTDEPQPLPDDPATARRTALLLDQAMADLAACKDKGGAQPACRRVQVLTALAGPLGDALHPKKPRALKAWPATTAVLQVAGRATVADGKAAVDLGDGIATVESELAGAKRGTVHDCATKPGPAAIACWHSDLPAMTQAADDVAGVVRAAAHPTVTAFVDEAEAGIVEGGKVTASVPSSAGATAAFSADGRYLLVRTSEQVTLVDTDTGAKKQVPCQYCSGLAVAGRLAYTVRDQQLLAYTVPALKQASTTRIGDARTYGRPLGAYGDRAVVELLSGSGARSTISDLAVFRPGGAKAKTVALSRQGGAAGLYVDPFDPRGKAIALSMASSSACSSFVTASAVDLSAATVEPIDGTGYGLPTPAQLTKGMPTGIDYVEMDDVHRGGDGRVYASAHSGSCDDQLGRTETIEPSLWRLDGTTWVSVDAGPLSAERTFGPRDQLVVASGRLRWRHGEQASTLGQSATGLVSPPGFAVFGNGALAPHAGRKVAAPKPLVVSAAGIGPLTVGASVPDLLAKDLLTTSVAGSASNCGLYLGTGALKDVWVMTGKGVTTVKHLGMDRARFATDAGAPPYATVADLKKVYGAALTQYKAKPGMPPGYYAESGGNLVFFLMDYNEPDRVYGYHMGTKSVVLDDLHTMEGLC